MIRPFASTDLARAAAAANAYYYMLEVGTS
jgi:hypothetical protein